MDGTLPERADYGLDAPYVVRNLALAGLASLAIHNTVSGTRPA